MTEYFEYTDDAGTHFYRIADGAEKADSLYEGEPVLLGNLSAKFIREEKAPVDASRVPKGFRVDEAPKLAFVGPEPEPAEAPAVTTPFSVDRATGYNYLQDSRGNYLGEISGSEISTQEDGELADLVVRLLNEHFGAK